MRHRLRALWPAAKLVLGLAILFLIGRQFAADLHRPGLWERPLHPAWLALAAALYLAGIGCSAWYWQRLLRGLGERPGARTIARAYYIGHLGKYLPGKAWALFLRAGLARASGVPLGLGVLTALYEVLTTMAAGALLATVLFAWLAPSAGAELDWDAVRRLARLQAPAGGLLEKSAIVPVCLMLLAVTGLPLLPVVFNRLARRLPFAEQRSNPATHDGLECADAGSAAELPHFRLSWLGEGLLVTGIGWLLLGGSLAAVLHGILGEQLHWAPAALARVAAALALAYVAGFIILVAPGGLGVREFFLTLLLAPELEQVATLDPDGARSVAVLAVLVLRLVWTAAELIMAGVLYVPMAREARQHTPHGPGFPIPSGKGPAGGEP